MAMEINGTYGNYASSNMFLSNKKQIEPDKIASKAESSVSAESKGTKKNGK